MYHHKHMHNWSTDMTWPLSLLHNFYVHIMPESLQKKLKWISAYALQGIPPSLRITMLRQLHFLAPSKPGYLSLPGGEGYLALLYEQIQIQCVTVRDSLIAKVYVLGSGLIKDISIMESPLDWDLIAKSTYNKWRCKTKRHDFVY